MKKTRYFDENTKIMDKSKEESYIVNKLVFLELSIN